MTHEETDDDYFQPPWDTVAHKEDGDEDVPKVIDDKLLVEYFSDELGKFATEMKNLREENIRLKGQLALNELEQKLMVSRLVQESRETAAELSDAKKGLASSQDQASSMETELMQAREQVAALKQVIGRLKNGKAVSVAVQAAPSDGSKESACGAVAQQMTSRACDLNAFSSFRDALSATLTGSPEGYDNVRVIREDLIEDSGKDGEEVARSFGYASFAHFLLSDELSPAVSVRFKARPTPENVHILQAQAESNEHWAEKFRKTKALLDRKSAEVRQIGQRNRALQKEAHRLSARLKEKNARLEHFELSFQCIMCRERDIQIVYGCGHGTCVPCNDKWTRRDPTANRFRRNPDAPMENAGPPMCPAACGNRIISQTRFYGNT